MDINIIVTPFDKPAFTLQNDNLYEQELVIGADLGSFSFGLFSASELRLVIRDESGVYSRDDFVNAGVALYYGDVKMGDYTAHTVNRQDYIWEITAYDNIVNFDTAFTLETFPMPFPLMLAHCMYLAGLWTEDFDLDSLSESTIANVPGIEVREGFSLTMSSFTCRDVVSAIAELCGCQATLDRDGKLLLNNPFSGAMTWNYSDENADILTWDKETVPVTKIKTTQTPLDTGLIKTFEYGTDDGAVIMLSNQVFVNCLTQADIMTLLETMHANIGGKVISSISATELVTGDSIPYHCAGDLLYDSSRDLTGIIGKISYSGNFDLSFACPGLLEESTSNSGNKSGSIIGQSGGSLASSLPQMEIKTGTNKDITVTGTLQELIRISFTAITTAFAFYSATVKFDVTIAGVVTFALKIKDTTVLEYPEYFAVGSYARTYTYPITSTAGLTSVYFNVRSDGAAAFFAEQQSWASLIGANMLKVIAWDGRIEIEDIFAYIHAAAHSAAIQPCTASPEIIMPDMLQELIAQSVTPTQGIYGRAEIPAITDAVPQTLGSITNETNTTITLTMRNPVYTMGGAVDHTRFAVTGFIGAVPTIVTIHSANLETAAGVNLLSAEWEQGDISSGADMPSDSALRTDFFTISPGEYKLTLVKLYAAVFENEKSLERYTEAQLGYYTERQLEGRSYKAQLHYYDDTAYISSSVILNTSGTVTVPEGTVRIRATLYETGNDNMTLADIDCVGLRLEQGESTLYQWSNRVVLTVDNLSAFNSTIAVNVAGANLLCITGEPVPDFTVNFERVIYT